MPRPFVPSRSATAASVPPPSPPPPSPDVLRALDDLGAATNRYQQAVHGLADLFCSASQDETGLPTHDTLLNWSQLLFILADEGERIDQALERLDTDVRRVIGPAAAGGVR